MLLARQLDFPPRRRRVAGAGYVPLLIFCCKLSLLTLIPFSVCFLGLKNQGPLPTWHKAGKGKGEIQFGSGFGQAPEAAASWVRAAGTLRGTPENGENMQVIYVFT